MYIDYRLIVGNISKYCWKVLNTHGCRAKYSSKWLNETRMIPCYSEFRAYALVRRVRHHYLRIPGKNLLCLQRVIYWRITAGLHWWLNQIPSCWAKTQQDLRRIRNPGGSSLRQRTTIQRQRLCTLCTHPGVQTPQGHPAMAQGRWRRGTLHAYS